MSLHWRSAALQSVSQTLGPSREVSEGGEERRAQMSITGEGSSLGRMFEASVDSKLRRSFESVSSFEFCIIKFIIHLDTLCICTNIVQ